MKTLRRLRGKEQRGFTLIELVVVIAILGVLAAISVPMITNYMGSAKERSYNADKARIQAAVDAYYSAPGNTRHVGKRQHAILGAGKGTYNSVTQPGLTCSTGVGETTCTITLLVAHETATCTNLTVTETSPGSGAKTCGGVAADKTTVTVTGLTASTSYTFSVAYRATFLDGASVKGVAASTGVGLASPANPLGGTVGGDPTWADFQDPDDGFRGSPGTVSEDHLQGPGGAATGDTDGGWKTVAVSRSGTTYYVDTRDYLINFDTLKSEGLLDEVPSSASLDNKPSGSTNTYDGSYSWYVDADGKVNSVLYSYPTSDEKGYESGVYP